jgi:hypothetical protein
MTMGAVLASLRADEGIQGVVGKEDGIFTFSPGGDELVAIGWSARAGRFYRLLECC